MVKSIVIVVFFALTEFPAWAQDPQELMNALLQERMQQHETSHDNAMMRLEIERLELQEELRLRRSTDAQIAGELTRYCPIGRQYCSNPPRPLLQEALRRGLIEPADTQSRPRPALDCATLGDKDGSITDCYLK